MGIFSNPADRVFFGAILILLVAFVIFVVVSKVYQAKKDKQYEAEFKAKKEAALEEQEGK